MKENMVIYYSLESHSWEKVNELEQTVQRMQLAPQVRAENQGNDGVDLVDVDLVENNRARSFEIIYYATTELQKKKSTWFGKKIPEYVKVDLLVKGDELRVAELDAAILKDNTLHVKVVRQVSYALVSFRSVVEPLLFQQQFAEIFIHLIQERYKTVRHDIRVRDYADDSRCGGIFDGPVEDVIPLWKMLIGGGYGNRLEDRQIIFAQKQPDSLSVEELR